MRLKQEILRENQCNQKLLKKTGNIPRPPARLTTRGDTNSHHQNGRGAITTDPTPLGTAFAPNGSGADEHDAYAQLAVP